eukprot:14240119-Alexandrium_andersonii.AAC.1
MDVRLPTHPPGDVRDAQLIHPWEHRVTPPTTIHGSSQCNGPARLMDLVRPQASPVRQSGVSATPE